MTKKKRKKKWMMMEDASDDATGELVRSKRYILAVGRKVHNAGMQTGVLGGKRVK